MTTTQTGTLHQIVRWVEEHGEVEATARLKVLCLATFFKAKVFNVEDIDENTAMSEDCLAEIRAAAEKVVGTPCPH